MLIFRADFSSKKNNRQSNPKRGENKDKMGICASVKVGHMPVSPVEKCEAEPSISRDIGANSNQKEHDGKISLFTIISIIIVRKWKKGR